ncbi:hypothetical protein [Endozoicomonas sp. Mp262]|uniref:hypothetical protein n=1 Tax=Endozoicomonas sp. Mp262 TaxID=2919499 RepID=UPI0021D9BDA0
MDTRPVFYGASVTSRSEAQALAIVDRARVISKILERQGYQCQPEVVCDARLHCQSDARVNNIPTRFQRQVSPGDINRFRPYRLQGKDPLENEVACHLWGLEAIRNACFCIWDLTCPSSGSGFEIATALSMQKKCFCFSEGEAVSSTLNGCPSSLLHIVTYDQAIERHLLDFLAK